MYKKLSISGWYISGLVIWGSIASFREYGFIIPLINDHLTDLYSVPMFSYTIMKIMQLTYYPEWRPDLKFLVGAAVNLTLVFEVICPILSDRYTADLLDIICYFTGAVMYYFIAYRKVPKSE